MTEVAIVSTGHDRRRQESRRRLLAAARELFVVRGYHGTRPQDIARRAGVATGTFYLHFRNKEAIFLAFAEQAQNELIAEYEANLRGVAGLSARLRIILETMIDHTARHPGVLYVAFMDPVVIAPDDDHAWRIYDRLGGFVHMMLGESEPRTDYDLALIGHAVCGFMRHAAIYAARKQMALADLIDNVVGFIERALDTGRATSKGDAQ